MSAGARGPTRRAVLTAGSAAALAALAGCERSARPRYDGGWVGAAFERGHLLRNAVPATKSGALPEAAAVRRTEVVIVGAGIAGLGAARALMQAGIGDFQVLDLEDSAGGNSRGHAMGGMGCPLGAHYLPVPGETATEVVELLDELGLRRTVSGRVQYDERTLCHSPQERLYIHGGWREGLLPPIEALPAAERASTLAQYRAFSAAIAEAGARQRLRDSDGALALVGGAGRARCHDVFQLARQPRPGRAGAALVSRLLLSRRLRRRQPAGLGLGRHPLLREPARLSRAGQRGQRRRRCERGPADLARRQCLAGEPVGGAPG